MSTTVNAFDFSARNHQNLKKYSSDSRNNFKLNSDKKNNDKKPDGSQPQTMSLVNNAILYRA